MLARMSVRQTAFSQSPYNRKIREIVRRLEYSWRVNSGLFGGVGQVGRLIIGSGTYG